MRDLEQYEDRSDAVLFCPIVDVTFQEQNPVFLHTRCQKPSCAVDDGLQEEKTTYTVAFEAYVHP